VTGGDRDPAALTAAERLAEIAELLARGFQRYLAHELKARSAQTATREPQNLRNHLDVLGAAEAPCRSRARSPQSQERTA
jgi:hypothetical protein